MVSPELGTNRINMVIVADIEGIEGLLLEELDRPFDDGLHLTEGWSVRNVMHFLGYIVAVLPTKLGNWLPNGQDHNLTLVSMVFFKHLLDRLDYGGIVAPRQTTV